MPVTTLPAPPPASVRVNQTVTVQSMIPATYWAMLSSPAASIKVKDLTAASTSGYVFDSRNNRRLTANQEYTFRGNELTYLRFRGGSVPTTDRVQLNYNGLAQATAEVRTVRATTTTTGTTTTGTTKRTADALARGLEAAGSQPLTSGSAGSSLVTSDTAKGLLASVS